jgi:type IX secretion system PorP/SprF family membrane protein
MTKTRTYRWILLTLLLAATVFCATAQQKMQFTQYMFNGLVLNPAYAGADDALSLTFIQRSQWAGVDNAPTTQTLSAHTLFKKRHFGLGLTIVNDKVGVHKNLNIVTNYAYHLKTGSKSWLSMGILGGIYNQKSDYSSLIGPGNTDPKLYNPILSETFLSVGAGVYFRSPRFHAGLSSPEMIPKQFAFNDSVSIHLSELNLFTFMKYRFTLNESLDLEPSMLIKYMESVPLSFDVNLNLIIQKVLTTGFSYRKEESVDFLFKAQVMPQLQLGYSYDHAIGRVARLSNGSHEVMVQYVFRYAHKKLSSPR